jgi:hypothetical protein
MDPTQVQVGDANGPGLYLAPAGTAGPADTATPWPSPWQILGYMSSDGPTVSTATDQNEIVPWQSMVPLRTVVTKRAVTLHFILWQLNAQTLALYFDADVPTETAGVLSMDVLSDQPQHIYAVGIDAADTNQIMRIIFGRASLTDAGDMTIKRGEAVPLDCKMSALDSNGVLATVLLGPGPGGLVTATTVTRSGGGGTSASKAA